MRIKKIAISIVISLICLHSLALAGEVEEQNLYTKAQKIIDDYHGDTNQLKKAYALLQEIEKSNPGSKYVLAGYGRLAYKSGHISYGNYIPAALVQSKLYFDKAILTAPGFFDAYFYGTYPYLFSKDYNNAKKMMKQAQKISPDSAKVDILLGEIADADEDYTAVINYANAAIQKKPDNKILVDAYALLSTAYRKQKQYELADEAYQTIIQIEPDSPWARVNYSSFLRKYKKDNDRAIELAISALELMDFGMGHKVLGKAYYAKAAQLHWQQKQYLNSIDYFLLAIQHTPLSANAHFGLGMSYYHVGYENKDVAKIKQAKQSLQTAVQINQEHERAIKQLENVNKLLNYLSKQ